MEALIFKLVGGIGMFLMGMALLTDGVKAFAGDALRRALVKFTGTPTKAFFSGALVTAMVQSSSATTITVIGFVSAGLLTFPQSIGIVFGASLGTTGTSWIVAGLGLKVSVGFYALQIHCPWPLALHWYGAGRLRPDFYRHRNAAGSDARPVGGIQPGAFARSGIVGAPPDDDNRHGNDHRHAILQRCCGHGSDCSARGSD